MADMNALPAVPGAGLPAPVPLTMVHDVTVVTTRKLAQAKAMGVPPEEFGIDRDARGIRDCNYCFHEIVTKTEAQLIAEGYDEDQIKALEPYTGRTDIETMERDTVQEHTGAGDGLNSASRLVKLTEHYIRVDYEGSGRPCLYQVMTGGDQGEILRKDGKECVEPFDTIPFAATTPVPIPHRFIGRSIADLVMPLQREKTAMKRGALDNLYLHNNPRVEVGEDKAGPSTINDLLVSRPGGVVRTKSIGALNWQTTPDVSGSIFPMLQYLDAELETRTGLSKQTQGIDANALQNQSATAVAQVFSASQMRVKLIARIMAEGVRDIFALLHGTIRKHGQQQQTVRLRNKWIEINPRNWKTRDDMTINVGLGTGSKAQQFAQTMALANVQKELLAGGKVNLVGDRELYNTAEELTKIMGHRNPDRFFKNPEEKGPDGQLVNPPPPPPQDPKIAAVNAKAQLEMQQMQARAEIERIQAQADIAVQNRKAESEIAIAQMKARLEAQLALMQYGLDEKSHSWKMVLDGMKMEHDERRHQHETERTAIDMLGKAMDHEARQSQQEQPQNNGE
ncbi:portal protein [Bradyrhizobium ottawaense]|uniref:portal protein n=1 Tax=Bradyrhizobium ottawaense TaxID=931866 RepID=UPI0030F4714A